jgi:UDP-N-acetylglucosamine 2-epimerase (non-hydrolysing)
MKLLHVVGARPNFMKLAPVLRAFEGRAAQVVVHTGQHYDDNMSDIFFRQLGIGPPDINLEVGSASQAQQTAQVMVKIEPVLIDQKPDTVVVYGDVNSTVAAALVATKLGIEVAHVEAGLRSFDRTMPEEINRVVTDRIADLLLTPSADADENLLREGILPDRIHRIGNVMIDTLVRLLPAAEEAVARSALRDWIGKPYALVTLHRPSNVDDPQALLATYRALAGVAGDLPVIFPVHPRTRTRLAALAGGDSAALNLCEPLGYLEFLGLQKHATIVITDSGGVQEETTFLRVPCLTMRDNTERPVTVALGTNILIGRTAARIDGEVRRILRGETKESAVPPLWDGHAADRMAEILCGRVVERREPAKELQ